MKRRYKLAAMVAVVLMSACVKQETTKTAIPVPANATPEQRLVAGANIPVPTSSSKEGYNTAVNAGLAAGMTRSFGGAGLAGGLLGVMATPSAGPGYEQQMIFQSASGGERRAIEQRISEALYKGSGRNYAAQGYKRISEQGDHPAVVFAKDGCPLTRHGYYKRSCSEAFIAIISNDANILAGKPYHVGVFSTDAPADKRAFYRRAVDAMPNELSLYLPPETIGGIAKPARLYRKGREVPLQ